MRVLVTGAGRGGTSLVREVVKGLNIVKWYPELGEEDREFFIYKKLPDSYGTKLVTEYREFSKDNILGMMNIYQDLHLIFSLRNPIDHCMSKIVRGQPSSRGGDANNQLAPDATIEGAIKAVKYAENIYCETMGRFHNRVLSVTMEQLISYPYLIVVSIAQFLKIKEFPPDKAFEFYKYNTNKYQKTRYGHKLEKSQVDIHRNWSTAYGGFFKDRKEDIDKIREAFK